jgi:tRNA (cytidine/uridine-2'-O-)-methyltransferase
VDVRVWKNWDAFTGSLPPTARLIMTSARKGQSHHRFAFHTEDIIVLGPETRGLPENILASADHLVRIPIWGQVRSINLANCASVLLYEALRQTGELDRHEPAP